jgi:hypothetical protein
MSLPFEKKVALVTGTGCGMDLATDRNRGGIKCMSERLPVVFLVDVDDTLLDNDHIQYD